MKSIFIIILGYNNLDDLKLTISSFINQNYRNLKIVISDNASTDNSIEWVKSNYPDIVVLQNKENIGWAAGNNVGIEYALNNEADYILLSNNDIYIENTGLLSNMVNDLEEFKNENISILGTKVNYFHNKEKTHNTGWIMYPKYEKRKKYFNRYRRYCNLKLGKKYEVVDSADGSFFLVKSDVFKKIGLLNEKLFMYADEIEFCLRAWSYGFKVAVNKNLIVYHKLGTSSIPNSAFSNYYRTRNLFLIIKDTGNIKRYLVIYLTGIIKSLFINLIKKDNSFKKKISILISIISGAVDGILGVTGKKYIPEKENLQCAE